MSTEVPISPAWCVAFTFTPFSCPSRVQSRRSSRYPRPRFLCAFPNPSPFSSFDTANIVSSTHIDSSPDSNPIEIHPTPSLQLGLLTDSILETKWKNDQQKKERQERRQPEQAQEPFPAPPTGILDTLIPHAPIDDIIASDPYKAFATFTRIAAPTASLGRDAWSSLDVSSHSSSSAQTLSIEQTTPHSPYSTAAIAHRLLRYSYANQNLADFVQFFSGEFDNYYQIAEERRSGMLPRDGGGHEHIHCSVVSLTPRLLFARYYFNGDPSRVFRSRVYQVNTPESSDGRVVEMRIFRFYEETEQRLKGCNYDVSAVEWHNDDIYDWLEGCEVYWERYQPQAGERDEASVRLGIEPGTRFVGYMKGGGCELYSRELGGRIRVMDDLLLTAEDLWVADRGFDEHNNFVYGNRRGVPYKMKRVRSDGELAWTLSAKAQPPEGYVS